MSGAAGDDPRPAAPSDAAPEPAPLEPPPFLGTWRNVYLMLLGSLMTYIGLLWWLTEAT